MTRPEFNAFVRQRPASEEGRRLLGGLRWAGLPGCLLCATTWQPPVLHLRQLCGQGSLDSCG